MIPVAYTKSTNAEIVTVNAGSVTQNISKANGSVNSTMNSNTSNKSVNNVSASEREFKEKTVATVPGGYDSYFPLAAETTSPFAVDIKNTGYIVGGSHTTQQSESGDVRVSSYYDITYLRTALNGSQSSTTYSDSKLEVLTRTYLSNGLKRILDSYNSGNSDNNVSSSIRSYTKTSVGDLGLQKYDTARDQLKDVFAKDSSRVYGMHFMNAAISISNLIVAPKVVINGSTYTNYQMPEDSIDFRLKTKGYINFFAGTYYAPSGGTANNSFFSLYEINRNAVTNKITSMKHIEKIYGDPTSETKQYLYKYEGESAPSLPTGYVEMFDCSWIESPTMVNYSMYYYEIPVNAGEYALGSVEGKYGAYLCYLDIGASAASHQSVLGSIDFVYDNLSNKIVTVKDYSDSDTSLNYYIPSYVVIYTRNTDKDNGNFVKINNFTIKTRRSIASVNDGKATITSTLAGDDNAHLQVVATSSLGDNLSTTGGYVSS